MTTLRQKLFILLQHCLPKHLLTSLVFKLARVRNVAVKNFLIRQFVNVFNVSTEEVDATIPDDFATFNAFFTRSLAAGARKIDASTGCIVSPVDGTVSQLGKIEKDTIFQAKGLRYKLDDLLATDLPEALNYHNGRFATIYLAPYNYHRIHAPLAGSLRAARYVPGDLYSVNATTALHLPGLFARNERLVCHFETANERYVLIFVGALNVGSISTPWTGEIRPQKRGTVIDFDLVAAGQSTSMEAGALLGWFNMGSTVIMLMPDGAGEWVDTLLPGSTLKMGDIIGRLDRSGHD